jgi:hypothetical protein
MSANSAQAKFNDTINRLDALLDQRVRHEEAELARQDASLEDARRQRQRANAEARIEIQAVYADAYRSFGTEVPAPVDDELPARYRARLFNRLARRLPPDHELARIRADDISSQPIVFDNFEAMLLQAATAEGERPSIDNLPSDSSLVSRVRTDDMGEKSINWYGRESFIKGFTRPGRQVRAIVDRNSGQAIWGRIG